MLRQLSGRLQASRDSAERWLGSAVSDWLVAGGDLETFLGVRPARGSNRTPAELIRQSEVARLLRQLVDEAGGVAQAARILDGNSDVPQRCRELVSELRALGSPISESGIRRACHRQATRR